jgi:LytR cell envelope-related transcriptional attenuator
MRATPYALSVHHFISTVGADAGFAAIIGLAIVVLLFFAHARETATLRHRTTEAEDALHRLEQYVDQLARSGNVRTAEPAPAPAPASATSAHGVAPAPTAVPARAGTGGVGGFGTGRTVAPARAPVGAMAGAPGAPAGVGAPALNAATRLIPADDGTIAIRSNLPAAAVRSGTGATAAVMDPPAPAPSTTAGGANGNRIPPAPPPASAGQTIGGRERLPARPAAARPPVASDQRRRQGQRPGGSRIGRGAIVLAVALVAVVAAGALLVLTNSGGSSAGKTTTAGQAARTTSATSTHARKGKTPGAVTPATVTVAVLNGTSTSNLAHDISQKLQAAGFKPGNIATATDQTQSSTTVGYLPNDKRDAQAVAKSLKLAPGSVQAVDPNNRTVACNGSATSCSAQVVVTVGTDLAAHA